MKLEVDRYTERYGVATISRLLEIIVLFCKRALLKRRYSAKETNGRTDDQETNIERHLLCNAVQPIHSS